MEGQCSVPLVQCLSVDISNISGISCFLILAQECGRALESALNQSSQGSIWGHGSKCRITALRKLCSDNVQPWDLGDPNSSPSVTSGVPLEIYLASQFMSHKVLGDCCWNVGSVILKMGCTLHELSAVFKQYSINNRRGIKGTYSPGNKDITPEDW